MKKNPDSFDDYLAEISASLLGTSGEAALKRINSERMISLAFEEIVQYYPESHIRFLTDNRIAGQSGADMLMQIDDYEIRIELVDTTNEKPEIKPEQLENFKKIFIDNPSTEALVIVWTTDDLCSLQLTLSDIDRFTMNPNLMTKYMSKGEPFTETIKDILAKFLKVWETQGFSTEYSGGKKLNIQNKFNNYLERNLAVERGRRFTKEEKKLAVKQISEKNEIDKIQSVLTYALQGSKSDSLTSQLIKLSK